MYYSSLFVFSLVLVVNLCLSGAQVERDLQNSNYRMAPDNGRQDVRIDIGNGYNKHNVVFLTENPSSAGNVQRGESNPNIPGNRFGSAPHNEPQPNQVPRQPGNRFGSAPHNVPQPNQVPRQLGNRFGSAPHNVPQPNPGPRQHPDSTVNNIGNGYHQYNTLAVNSGGRTPQTQYRPYNTDNSGGTSFVSPSGNDRFNVGYGIDNHNQILLNGRPIQPAAPVNSGGRNPQARNDARNNGAHESNINQIYVNGRPVQPVSNDGRFSTYIFNDQTIQVLNSGSRQATNRDTQSQLKRLYVLYAQIQQIVAALNYEAERLKNKILN